MTELKEMIINGIEGDDRNEMIRARTGTEARSVARMWRSNLNEIGISDAESRGIPKEVRSA
jgi:hypothetical protein